MSRDRGSDGEPASPRRRVEVHADLEPGEELRVSAAVVTPGEGPTTVVAAPGETPPREAGSPAAGATSAAGPAVSGGSPEVDDARRLRELLDVAAHELRSPLVAIAGFADLLLRRWQALGTNERVDLVERVHARADEMHRLLDRLLELSPPGATGMVLHPAPLRLQAELDRSTEALRDQLEQHPLTLDASDDLRVWADPNALEHVLRNLLSNAAKFSPADAPIQVMAGRVGDGVRIGVSDEGIGVAEDDLQRIFERHYTRPSGTTSLRSSGLGLGIARAFVEAHGGEIWAESEPGEGSTFWFTLPGPPPEPGDGPVGAPRSEAGEAEGIGAADGRASGERRDDEESA